MTRKGRGRAAAMLRRCHGAGFTACLGKFRSRRQTCDLDVSLCRRPGALPEQQDGESAPAAAGRRAGDGSGT